MSADNSSGKYHCCSLRFNSSKPSPFKDEKVCTVVGACRLFNNLRTRKSSACAGPLLRVRDRKSTRLNSSHVRISYAVFCLKKKRASDVQSSLLRCCRTND